MSDESDSELDILGNFLNIHYEKFALMGIFGTVTVFLSDYWPVKSSISAQMGIVASMSLFTVSAGWIMMKTALRVRDGDQTIPSFHELAFGVISFSTGVLIISIASVFQQFGEATQLVVEGLISFLVFMFYFRSYLGGFDRDYGRQRGPIYLPMVGMWLSIYLILEIFANELRNLTADLLGLEWVLFAPAIISLVVAHYIITEGLLGLHGAIEAYRNPPADKVSLLNIWDTRVSLAICLISVSIVTFVGKRTAELSVGPNIGYYRIAGLHSIDYLLGHWVIVALTFTPLLLWKPSNTPVQYARLNLSRLISAIILIISIYGITVAIPRGVHVIPL